MHLGLGKSAQVDSIVVRWPDNHVQTLKSIQVDQTVVLKQSTATENDHREPEPEKLLIEDEQGPFVHHENKFIAFSVERLIHPMLSTRRP
jgi:hypothetical protein